MMNRSGAMALLLGCLAAAAPAKTATSAPQTLSSMPTGSVTSQPIGHYEFCRKHPLECSAQPRVPAPAKITAHGWDVVRSVNISTNKSITPMTDMEIYGREEVWTYPDDAGDCEDFVLLKRAKLIEAGFPASDLLITVVRKPDGEGHAVLTLRSTEGDFVLDNLVDDVRPWFETPYTYLKRQATFDAGRWVSIEDGRDVLVGALN